VAIRCDASILAVVLTPEPNYDHDPFQFMEVAQAEIGVYGTEYEL